MGKTERNNQASSQTGDVIPTIPIVLTSESGWLKQIAEYYKDRQKFILEDDALVGLNMSDDTLLKIGLRAKLSQREWLAVLISTGITGLGAWMIIMAVLDPEPYSKIAAFVGTAAGLVLTGGTTAIYILVKVKPPKVITIRPNVFEINW